MRTRTRTTRPAGSVAALAALAAAALAGTAPAQAAPSAPEAGAARAQARAAAAAAPLTTDRAMARARATRQPVTVTSLTTSDSLTTAHPDGKLTVTQTLLPTRTWRPARTGGSWVPLSANLVRSGRRLATAATAAPLTLSAGDAGPLATMSGLGRSLSLNWPSALPVPAVSGPTATYPGVLPGVDLAVTADAYGGVSTTLVVHDAAAAANPRLQSLSVTVSASAGLRLSADTAGNLSVGVPGAQPVFTAQAPRMWDSAPPPAGTATVTASTGQVLIGGSGLPAYSSAIAPGDGARITSVPVTVSGSTLTLAPPAAALTGPGVAYPVYIDPPWHNSATGDASNWAQVESGYSTQSFWPSGTDLQLGNCTPWGNCPIGTVRDFFTMPISSQLTGAAIDYSYLYMTDDWAPACGIPQSQGQVGLYTVSPFSKTSHPPTWNSEPTTWSSDSLVQQKTFSFQNTTDAPGTSCPSSKNDVTWDITGTVKADAGDTSSQAFGLRASDESGDGMGWKQFYSSSVNIHMTTEYNYSPAKPSSLSANGGCGTSANPTQIGNDDVIFSAYQNDTDGDTTLSTTFTILNSDGSQADKFTTATGGKGTAGPTTIQRPVIQAWHTDGATKAYTYHWSATTTDGFPTTAGVSATCYFTYDPNGPGIPGLTVSPQPPATVALGGTVTATITPPSGCSPTTTPCPTSYVYQIGSGKPQTATVGSGSCTAASCPVTLTASQYGTQDITVAGVASGNPGSSKTAQVDVVSPATPYTDGYIGGGTYPDLLTVGTGSDPSLWVHPGAGNGVLGGGIDIGSVGTGISPGTDGPADWYAGSSVPAVQVLHGDFTGHHVQDVMAYYPAGTHAGTAQLIPGDGLASTLQSESAYDTQIGAQAWADGSFTSNSDVPLSLVAAGNAGQLGIGLPDIIGIYGDATAGYELALYTTTPGQAGGYGGYNAGQYPYQLSAGPGPDGSTWDKFQLATAQPGGNPSATILLALDTSNGQLWESANPGCPPTNPAGTCSATTFAGASGTWTKLTVPWGATPPTLASADINHAGQIELWTTSSGTATAYTLNTTTNTITAEASGNQLKAPANDWPLTDGAGACPGTTPATALDTITTSSATLNGGYNWSCDITDSTFDTALALDGKTGFMAPATDPVPNGDPTATISVWFKTTATNEALVSLEGSQVTPGTPAGTATTSGYNPVLYVGADGKLCFEWWNGHAYNALSSTSAVNDGLWHHATLAAATSSQTLTLDGTAKTLTGTVSISASYFYIGAGHLGGGWPDEKYNEKNGNDGYLTYFNGQIADATFTK